MNIIYDCFHLPRREEMSFGILRMQVLVDQEDVMVYTYCLALAHLITSDVSTEQEYIYYITILLKLNIVMVVS